MKRLLSYVWPFTKEVQSTINGTLELTWMNGKKVLDSQHANYSYGTLQKLLCFGLSKVNFSHTSDILLLGLGGGSIIKSLRDTFNHQGKITAIEIDPIVIDIAKNEFDIQQIQNMEIICEDAFSYMGSCKTKYDVIIVDIFIDNQVPDQFYSEPFWKNISECLNKEAYVLFNAGINLKEKSMIEKLQSKEKSSISFTIYDNIQGTNTLLIGRKI